MSISEKAPFGNLITDRSLLGQLDNAIIAGIESFGRYVFKSVYVHDYCDEEFLFEDKEGTTSNMAVRMSFSPVDKDFAF